MPKSRRKAREAALKALYRLDIGGASPDSVIADMREHEQLEPDLIDYAEKLVRGVFERRQDLDSRLTSIITGYDYERVAPVDKNVMRIASYELYHEPSIAPAISIDEAIEIARKYSTEESGAFVNGILDRMRKQSPKANWDPATAPPEHTEESAPREQIEVLPTEEVGPDEAKKLARFGWKLRTDE